MQLRNCPPGGRWLRTAGVFFMAAARATGQGNGDHAHHIPATLADSVYVAAARRATAGLQSPGRRAGRRLRPALRQCATPGRALRAAGSRHAGQLDINQPSVLMFASISGQPTLVGVAYTFYLPTDRMRPRGWTGPAEVWHSHDDIARIPGKHIVVMHTWLVDSPLGPLAHDNPALPYLAIGLTPPTPDDVSSDLSRRIGLAIALTTDPPSLIDLIQRQSTPHWPSKPPPRRAAFGNC